MGRDLNDLDVYDLDSREVEAHDELLTVPEAVKLFTHRCPTCDQRTGISYQQILKAIRMGRIKSYNKFGGKRYPEKRERVYVNYYDVKAFDEKQRKIKARRQWDD